MSNEKEFDTAAVRDEQPKQVKAVGFPCKQCGNQMAYSPETADLCCPYCRSHGEIDTREVEAPEYLYFPDSDTYDAPNWEEEGTRALLCPSCGAETVMSAAVMTAKCPFCESNYVTEASTSSAIIQPETMMPFRISSAQAEASFHTWAKKRFWAPRDFRSARHRVEMKGIYLPFWTFDAELTTDYSGQGGRRRIEHYTVRVNGKTQTRTRTVTDWYPIAGSEHLSFDDLPCCAAKSVDTKLLGKLGPYSMKVLNVYNPAYLAGFFAERYSIGLKEGFAMVSPQAESRMEAHIRSVRGYDTYRFMSYKHHYDRITFKHILLPVWRSSYKYGERSFPILINGETGKIAGRAPVSKLKVALACLGGLLLATGLSLLLYFFGGDSTTGDEYLYLAPEEYAVVEQAPDCPALPDLLL